MHHNLSDHHHSPVVKWIYIISVIVSTLAAINVGLAPFGYNVLNYIVVNMPMLSSLLAYFVGICGVIGLIMIIMCAVQCCSENHSIR